MISQLLEILTNCTSFSPTFVLMNKKMTKSKLLHLKSKLSSNASIVTKNDNEYSLASKQYASNSYDMNWTMKNLSPDAIVYCATEVDVVETVLIATNSKPLIHLTARSGGHSYSGHSSRKQNDGGWIVDVSKMDIFEHITDTVIRIGPGLKLHRLNAELLRLGLSFPKGACRGVAIGGHLQSSSWGALSVSHGSGLDHVLEFRIVLADGRVVDARPDNMYNEIYYCVLGGFPGSFGIVTRYTLKCIPNSEFPHSRLLIRTWSLADLDALNLKKILSHLQCINIEQEKHNLRDFFTLTNIGLHYGLLDLLPDLPIVGHISDYIDVSPNPDASGSAVQVFIMWTGRDSGAFTNEHYKTILAPLNNIANGLKNNFPYSLNIAMPLSIPTNLASTFQIPKDHRYIVSGNHSNKWLDEKAIYNLCTEVIKLVKERKVFYIQLFMGGKSSQWHRNKNKNALGWRDYRIMIDNWKFFLPSEVKAENILSLMEQFNKTMPWSKIPGTSIRLETFMTPDLENPTPPHDRTAHQLRAYYPDPGVLERLFALKKAVDPFEVFNGSGTVPLINK